jgi:hypothetical protein
MIDFDEANRPLKINYPVCVQPSVSTGTYLSANAAAVARGVVQTATRHVDDPFYGPLP